MEHYTALLLLFLFPGPAPDDSVSCVHRGAAPRKDAATKSEARFYGSLYLLILESRSDMWAMYDNAQNRMENKILNA